MQRTDETRRPVRVDDEAGLVRRGLRRAVRTDATAFGYSILVTATFGAASLQAAPVTAPRLFLFVLGATFGFALLEAAASRGFRVRIRDERSEVVLVGTALAPVSVSLGLAAGLAVCSVLPTSWAWAASPFAATVVYVLIAGAQLALARAYERRHPPREEE